MGQGARQGAHFVARTWRCARFVSRATPAPLATRAPSLIGPLGIPKASRALVEHLLPLCRKEAAHGPRQFAVGCGGNLQHDGTHPITERTFEMCRWRSWRPSARPSEKAKSVTAWCAPPVLILRRPPLISSIVMAGPFFSPAPRRHACPRERSPPESPLAARPPPFLGVGRFLAIQPHRGRSGVLHMQRRHFEVPPRDVSISGKQSVTIPCAPSSRPPCAQDAARELGADVPLLEDR